MSDAAQQIQAPQPEGFQQKATRFLYRNPAGRLLLRALVCPGVSKAAGAFLDTRLSKPLVNPFIRANDIDISQFEGVPFGTFNDCFSRIIKPELRPIDDDPRALVSPADSRLTVLPITAHGRMVLKGTAYTAATLLRDAVLAKRYEDGYAFIFRLSVDDYHRYCFPASGVVGTPKRIEGVLHTVSPIANEEMPIYKQNTREYVELDTEAFGQLILMEVGALLVGRIVNHPLSGAVEKGQEKGYFQYGGSTVVVLAQKDALTVDETLLEASERGEETRVLYGQRVAYSRNL
ncbi:MAG: phosphatidylserine decarboxylase [Eggerthellaceae bacterium]|nr:phosphatidylserine decarboxylase [Eggerthellaceae bacterium]